jgi:hypothetical protein
MTGTTRSPQAHMLSALLDMHRLTAMVIAAAVVVWCENPFAAALSGHVCKTARLTNVERRLAARRSDIDEGSLATGRNCAPDCALTGVHLR